MDLGLFMVVEIGRICFLLVNDTVASLGVENSPLLEGFTKGGVCAEGEKEVFG